jgi:KaiC/GvpD/RAD55 family RecA-like ATPase
MVREKNFDGLKNDLNDFSSTEFNEWDLERAIILNAIFNHKLFDRNISSELFSRRTYKLIWELMGELQEERIVWDYMILYSKINSNQFKHEDEKMNILGYLEYEFSGVLSLSAGYILNPEMQNFYFKRLKTAFKDKILKKTFIDLGFAEIAESLPAILRSDLFYEIFNKNLEFCADDHGTTAVHTLQERYEMIMHDIENKNNTCGVLSQIGNLDTFFNGFQPARLYILGARPSMGKSALCMNVAVNAAKHKKKIYFRALEESGESVSKRMLSYLSHVDNEHIQRGTVSYSELDRLQKIQKSVATLDECVFIDDTERETAEHFCERMEKSFKEHPYDMIIIDHLVEFKFSGENRAQSVGDAAKRIKQMAKTLKVPVLCATQLNRLVESRKDQRPMLSDLKESGGIEEAADAVIFLYRDRHNPTTESLTELLIQKNRDGRCGVVYLKFLSKFMMFDSDDIPNQTSEVPEFGSLGHHPDFL